MPLGLRPVWTAVPIAVRARLNHAFAVLPPYFPLTMTDPHILDEIGARLSEILATSPAGDVEKNLRALLAAFFDRFDLVTRDDFEVQKRVLERAQARIAELEKRLAVSAADAIAVPPRV